MKRLILMRHAKSDWSRDGTADIARPLNERGRKSASALGNWLREMQYIPDEVICSSATRTRQTLAGLSLPEVTTSFARNLYLAEPEEMAAVLRGTGGETVLMLGHNSGIATLAEALLKTPPSDDDFGRYPTGATLVADFDISEWKDLQMHSGTVIDFTVLRRLM